MRAGPRKAVLCALWSPVTIALLCEALKCIFFYDMKCVGLVFYLFLPLSLRSVGDVGNS